MHRPNTIAIQQSLIEKISKLTQVAQKNIEIHTPLAEYGLDSILAVGFSGELQDWLGITIEPTIAWDFPTIAEMSQHLASQINIRMPYSTTASTMPRGVHA